MQSNKTEKYHSGLEDSDCDDDNARQDSHSNTSKKPKTVSNSNIMFYNGIMRFFVRRFVK